MPILVALAGLYLLVGIGRLISSGRQYDTAFDHAIFIMFWPKF